MEHEGLNTAICTLRIYGGRGFVTPKRFLLTIFRRLYSCSCPGAAPSTALLLVPWSCAVYGAPVQGAFYNRGFSITGFISGFARGLIKGFYSRLHRGFHKTGFIKGFYEGVL